MSPSYPRRLFAIGLLCALAFAGLAEGGTRVALETNHGRIELELEDEKAPATVASFLEGVRAGFYDGTVFHRVVPGFMIQGGGFDTDLQLKPTDKNLQNEADNGLENLRGTVAMARKADPHSASVQFFINLVDNAYLNHQSKTPRGWGYTVFGKVVSGMDVADRIAGVQTLRTAVSEAQPVDAVVIERAAVVGEAAE